MRSGPQWKWHLDEVFVKIHGVQHYLRAVVHEGEVLESVVTKTRDRKAALKFLRKLMRRYGRPEQIVTDSLRLYGAALRELGAGARQHSARHANNRAENSHLPFRRRERAMLRFRRMKTLQPSSHLSDSTGGSLSCQHKFLHPLVTRRGEGGFHHLNPLTTPSVMLYVRFSL